jgi:hypothetical protein
MSKLQACYSWVSIIFLLDFQGRNCVVIDVSRSWPRGA